MNDQFINGCGTAIDPGAMLLRNLITTNASEYFQTFS